MTITYTTFPVPWGQVILAGDEAGIRFLSLRGDGSEAEALAEIRDLFPGVELQEDRDLLAPARQELEEYFAGIRKTFSVPVAPVGTEFQQEVWEALRSIPYGEVRSYQEVAQAVGRPTAARAVGGACGRNPIGIITPCHRVIRSDGGLGGFGGGLEWKEWLLRLEGAWGPWNGAQG